ncbi:DUF624 domain-containing protein [Natrialba taiwanensis]|uniref:DUF624 domain-containing protein n=1 Tax=Natrialba taiwanensis TaxID=160846 RepID=UPI001EF9DEC8|nr:hypothetical protein [Natrialba taiwanensis]
MSGTQTPQQSETTARTASQSSGVDPLYAACRGTTRFVWDHLVSVIGISLAWFLASLPIVTIGPATVGAYRAVLLLREDGADRVDCEAVATTVRRQFVHATLLALVPLALLAVATNYTLAFLATGTVAAGLLALCCTYVGLYAGLVLVPTLLELAAGTSATAALAAGYRWTASHPVGAVSLGIVTGTLFLVTVLLTVAVALLFAGVAFGLHAEFIASVAEPAESNRDRHDERTIVTS